MVRSRLSLLAVRSRVAALALALAASVPVGAMADDGDPSEAIVQAQTAIRAELLKSANVGKTVQEGLEAYRQQQALQNRAVGLRETLRQAPAICQTIQSEATLSTGARQAQAKIFAGQRKALQGLESNSSTVATLDVAHRTSNKLFCSQQEHDLRVCDGPSSDPRYANLAGADQNALFLFQSRDGGDSYPDGRDGPQAQAVDSYIRRVVGIPPEQLRTSGAGAYRKNQRARAYVEMQRRYEAFLSMATYSLNQIKEAHNPLK